MDPDLGRKSLQSRLSSFYSLVAPEKLVDFESKFDDIYNKYGGSIENERKLQRKLRKLYGSEVLLNVVTDDGPKKHKASHSTFNRPASVRKLPIPTVEEDEVLLMASTEIITFTSPSFDPYTALVTSDDVPTVGDLILDNVDRCTHLLPKEDEYYAPPPDAPAPPLPSSSAPAKNPRAKEAPPFVILSESLKKTPFATLQKAMSSRRKVKVMIRYINCIRGHVVGFVEGFDKHFNILMKSATETYSTRLSDPGNFSPSQVEQSRRHDGYGKGVKTRFIKQMMIRGDMVVSVSLAN